MRISRVFSFKYSIENGACSNKVTNLVQKAKLAFFFNLLERNSSNIRNISNSLKELLSRNEISCCMNGLEPNNELLLVTSFKGNIASVGNLETVSQCTSQTNSFFYGLALISNSTLSLYTKKNLLLFSN